jgi:hypothetical protein
MSAASTIVRRVEQEGAQRRLDADDHHEVHQLVGAPACHAHPDGHTTASG